MQYYFILMYLVGCFTTGWLLGKATCTLIEWIRSRKRKVPDTFVERMRRLAESGNCYEAAVRWYRETKDESFCDRCVGHSEKRPDYWDCTKEGESAKRWLEEQGVSR